MTWKSDLDKLISILDEVNANSVLLLCHPNADPDAICASYVLFKLLPRLKPRLKLGMVAKELSKLSRHVLSIMPMEVVQDFKLEKADAFILVDTNTIQQLGDWATTVERSDRPIIVIDHHSVHPDTERLATLCIVDEKATSTCEMIYHLFKEFKTTIDKDIAQALLIGIAFDSRHFALSRAQTIEAIWNLINLGANIEEAISILSLPMDIPERIARLKCAQRLKLMRIEDWVVAISQVSSFHASAANALIELGADVAIVGGIVGEELRISLRSTRGFFKSTGIHLGQDIAQPLGPYVGGSGGGHSTAAGVNGKDNLKKALSYCIKLLREKLVKDER